MAYKVVVFMMSAILIIGGLVSCKKEEPIGTYRIGASTSQTGQYAGIGLQSMEGMQLMADKINNAGGVNGIPLELVIYDDKSEATEASLNAKKLIEEDRVHILASATATGLSMAMVPIGNESMIPTVILAGTTLADDRLGSWVFRPTGTEVSYVTLNFAYLSDMGISKYAALIENSSYGEGGKVFLPQMSSDHNVTIVEEQYFDPGATDMTPQLTNIRNSEAEAIFVWGGTPSASMAVKQARDMGIDLIMMGTPPNAAPNMIEQFGEYYEIEPSFVVSTSKFDVWQQLDDTDRDKAEYQEFAEAYMNKYGHPASMWALLGGQFILFMEDGLKRANANPSNVEEARSKIRDAFESTSNLELLTGVYTMSPEDHFGQTEWRMVLITFKDGQKVYLP